jgi:hypothetical protein
MIHIPRHKESHLQAIFQAKAALTHDTGYKEFIASGEDSTFFFPHEIYHLSLSDFQDKGGFFPIKTSTRTIEVNKDKEFIAVYDVREENSTALVFHVQTDNAQLKQYKKGIEKALQTAGKLNGDIELRILKFNAIYFDAIWLHQNDSTKDVFIPIRSIGMIKLFYPYNKLELLSLINEAVKGRISKDDSIAP